MAVAGQHAFNVFGLLLLITICYENIAMHQSGPVKRLFNECRHSSLPSLRGFPDQIYMPVLRINDVWYSALLIDHNVEGGEAAISNKPGVDVNRWA